MPAFGELGGTRSPAGTVAVSQHAPSPPRAVLLPAAAMSLFAALVHLWATPEHLSEWWGYGAFFLAAALAQGVYAAALLRRPSRRLLLAGILGNSSIVLLYLATRTLGVLLFWRLVRERVGLVLLVAATALLVLAHLPHLILLFELL